MLTSKKNLLAAQSGALIFAVCFAASSFCFAGDNKAGIPLSAVNGVFQKTKRDLPNESHSHPNHGKLAKLDLDGDFNYDGVVSNSDRNDNGEVQEIPPGLVVGVGELTQMVIRLTPHKVALNARTRIELEVIGINRSVASGDFGSLREEIASMGHIRVWADSKRSKLLLDSQKTGSRIWTMPLEDLRPDGIMAAPRVIWVEGVRASGAHTGDIRLDVRLVDERRESDIQKGGVAAAVAKMGFRPAFDHVLLTVARAPHKKAFVNGNLERVWSTGDSAE